MIPPMFNPAMAQMMGQRMGMLNPMAAAQPALAQLRANPVQMLQQAKFYVSGNMNDPQKMVDYLVESGQLTQDQVAQLKQNALQMNPNLKF